MSISQKHHVDSLRFFLFDRALHPELFEIVHGRSIVKSGYEARIWVTGCSHVIGFHRERSSLTQVVADARLELPQRGRLLDLPFRGEKGHDTLRADGIRYMMNFQVESMSQAVYSRTHHDLARAGTRRGLFVPFPAWMFHGLTPFSFLDYDAKPNELHLFAFHAFPDKQTVVKSQSIFELA